MILRCTLVLPAVAVLAVLLPAQERASRPPVLVLGGPTLDPATVRTAVAPLVASGTAVLVPSIPEVEDVRRSAFLPAGDRDDELARDLAAAYRLHVRQAVRDHLGRAGGRPIRKVIALYDGAPAALALMRAGLVTPRHVVLLDPDPGALESVAPPETTDGNPTARLNVDVFLSQGTARHLEARAKSIRAALGKWTSTVRVFFADLRGRPLEAVAREMAGPLRGLRTVRVSPDGLREIERAELFRSLDDVDAVFAGEKHDNTAFHEFTLALLEAMDRGRGDLLLSLEMFERDVQPLLDRYLAGEIDEAALLAGSRPWPNYRTDYRPLVEYARQHRIPVLASNIPRRYASRVAREGMEALEALDAKERGWVAREALAASPPYRREFEEVMQGMEGDRLERMYAAQCVKDDTMAESIRDYFEAHPAIRRVLHVNGSFHSSFGLGTVNGLRKRCPDLRVAIVTCQPTPNPRAVDLLLAERQDDYLVFCPEPLPQPRRRPAGHPRTAPRKMPQTEKKAPKQLGSGRAAPEPATSGKSAGSAAGSAG